jgi:hypothetical protein
MTWSAARYVALTVGGTTALRPPRSTVRFLYGHTLEAKNCARFRRTLRMLRNAFDFVSFQSAVTLLRDPSPPAGRYLTFSFDDGYLDHYELIAPLLTEAGASACFFVTTGFIGCDDGYREHFLRSVVRQPATRRPMTWRMVKELADAGFEIGAHTVDHPNLAQIGIREAERQVIESAVDIERRLTIPCRWFAWPFGTAAHFPTALLPETTTRFDGVFSAIRSKCQLAYDGQVINRDHFEPSWPTSHVRYFAFRRTVRAGSR